MRCRSLALTALVLTALASAQQPMGCEPQSPLQVTSARAGTTSSTLSAKRFQNLVVPGKEVSSGVHGRGGLTGWAVCLACSRDRLGTLRQAVGGGLMKSNRLQ